MNTRLIVQDYVKTWENRCYLNGIPDEVPLEILNKVPSYKRIALAILNNDMGLKCLGYEKRVSKYYVLLKRIEINARETTNKQQLKLKL